jgi:hypothetical protein
VLALHGGAERCDSVTIRGFVRLPVLLGPESWAVPEDRRTETLSTCPQRQQV